MNKNNFKLSLVLSLLFSSSANAEFFLNVDLKKEAKNILIESPFDQFGFDENGIHRTGELVDPEGFGSNGLKSDSNSVINQTLNQNLDSAYNVSLTQDVVEGDFGYATGTITFNTTPITISTVEGNQVVLDSGLTNNPFPSGIDIIRNGNIETNSVSANFWQNTVDVYDNVSVAYWTPYTLSSTTSSAVYDGDKSFSLSQRAATRTKGDVISSRTLSTYRYRYVANEATYDRLLRKQ